MVQHDLKNTFTRGIVSHLVAARNDIQLYAQAAEDLVNIVVLKEGGVSRRSGTRYRGPAKYDDKKTRLIPFVFSLDQAYALEFGDLYVRPWAEFGNVLDGSDVIVDIVSPFGENDIDALSWYRTNDVMYFGFPSLTQQTQKLKRLGHDNWVFEDVTFVDGPYLPINDQYNTLTTAAVLTTGASITFTWANTDGLNSGQGILATDVGRHVRCQFGGKWSWGVITARLTDKTATVLIKEGNGNGGPGADALDLGGAQSLVKSTDTGTTETGSANKSLYSSYSWRLGAFSDTTGYPGCVAYFQDRIFWARTNADPNGVWYSRSSYPEIMSPSDVDGTVAESHGGMIRIQGANEILWLQEGPRLQVGTSQAVRSIGVSNSDEAFGPRNVSQRLEIAQGTSSVRPEVVGPSSVHSGRYSKTLNDLYFDYQANTLVGPALSVTASHLFRTKAKAIVFQQEPNNQLWVLLENGNLVVTTIERYEKVIGMSRHYTLRGVFKSMCSIPGEDQDELYTVVRRTFGETTKQFIETMDPLYDHELLLKQNSFFVDCGGTYYGVDTNTVTDIDWLEGEIVDVLADGHIVTRQTITGGTLTLPGGRLASAISFGIPITAWGRTLRAPTSLPDGAALGRKCRVIEVIADVYATLSLSFRSDQGRLDKLKPLDGPDPYTSRFTLMHDTYPVLSDGSWSSDGQVTFECVGPHPMTLRALNIKLETET